MNNDFIDFSTLPTLFQIYDLQECFVFYKDLNSRYLGCNKYTAYKCGLPNEGSIVGLTDDNMCWKEIAHVARSHDAHILATQQKNIFIEPGIFPNEAPVTARSYKYPIFKNSHLYGLLCIAYIIHNPNNQQSPSKSGIYFHTIEDSIKLPQYSEQPQLSTRQIDCIKLLIQGMSVKNIAKYLNLSPRTVESHLEMAKIKLNCSNKLSLIATCLRTQQHIFYN